MPNGDQPIWLAAGVRSPFVAVDGPFAGRDSHMLSVPVAQAMAEKVHGPIDFAVWGAVVQNLAYANLAREIWLQAKLDPHEEPRHRPQHGRTHRGHGQDVEHQPRR